MLGSAKESMLNKAIMATLLNKTAPEFELTDQAGKIHKLSDYRGQWVILYFYPKDLTPGCTVEACSFRDNLNQLTKLDAVVLGVSADTAKRHDKFATTYKLNFPLLADVDKTVIKAYDAWGRKKFMGREYDGILRNTYIIDPKGKVAKIYEGVKPAAHVAEIMADLKQLK